MWSARGGLREVPSILIRLGNFWYLRKVVAEESGRVREVVATRGSTVYRFLHALKACGEN